MLGHDHVSNHIEPIASPGLFERSLKDILRVGRVEEGLPPVTSEGDEVETVGLLETHQSPRHGVTVRCSGSGGSVTLDTFRRVGRFH